MHTKPSVFWIYAPVVVIIWLHACNGNNPPVAAPPSPTGTFTATETLTSTVTPTASISPTLISTTVPTLQWTGPTVTPGGPFPVGIYEPTRAYDANRLEFLADGTYTVNLALVKFVATGTYVVDGNEIVLHEESGPCSGRPGGYPGRYIWSFDGTLLVFTVIGDECPVPRPFDLQRQWIKQP